MVRIEIIPRVMVDSDSERAFPDQLAPAHEVATMIIGMPLLEAFDELRGLGYDWALNFEEVEDDMERLKWFMADIDYRVKNDIIRFGRRIIYENRIIHYDEYRELIIDLMTFFCVFPTLSWTDDGDVLIEAEFPTGRVCFLKQE